MQESNTDGDIIYKQSVFQLKFELNKKYLLNHEYFNLEKLPDLRILNNGFLRLLRKKYNKSQDQMAKTMGVPLRTLIGWESSRKTLPFKTLIKIIKYFNIPSKKLYKIIENCEFSFGEHHGKNRIRLPLKATDFNLVKYLIPVTPNKTYVVINAPNDIKEYIIKNFSIDKYTYNKNGQIVIYSYLLNKFLKTFYIYKKEMHIDFPLTTEVPQWLSKGVDLKRAVIVPLLLTDGGERLNGVVFTGNNDIAHNIFVDSWYFSLNKIPSSFKIRMGEVNFTKFIVPNKIISELKKICPTFKTYPANESKKEYLNHSQPNIDYFFKRPKIEQQIALRLWFITEGSIGISLNKKRGLINPALRIACAHPGLTNQLRQLGIKNDITFSIRKSRSNWSGIQGLQSTSISSIVNLLKMGGFIRGVNVSRKSKSFTGLDKQDVLLGILEFMARQRKNNKYKSDNIKEIRTQILNIIKSKESEDSILNLFSLRTKKPKEEITQIADKKTLLNAKEALAHNWVDRVIEKEEPVLQQLKKVFS